MTQHNLLYCVVHYVTQLHVSALFRPSSVCIRLALRLMYPDDKSGYINLKGKRIQPEDALKRAETCSCVTYCTTQYNKFCCVSTVSNIFCI